MYEEYEGARTGLSTEDIGNIQALYGAPQADPNNNTLNQATPLNVGQGIQTGGDINSLQDTDFYQLNGLQAGSNIAIRLQTQGISLLDWPDNRVPRTAYLSRAWRQQHQPEHQVDHSSR